MLSSNFLCAQSKGFSIKWMRITDEQSEARFDVLGVISVNMIISLV